MIYIKAVILAGGIGNRLRPVTDYMPKPLARVMDRPIISHLLELLSQNGIRDVFVTLRFLPRSIMDYLGDGSRYGVNIEYIEEHEALGTAGGVKNCRAVCDGGLLVMSGDAAVNIDINKFADFHFSTLADVTIAAVRGPEPYEFGTLITDGDGRITKFVEKPGREAVCGELVNTGIYILSEKALNAIPDGYSDFAGNVFPELMRNGSRLFAFESDGYWLDIGSCSALLEANIDALNGKYAVSKTQSLCTEGVTVREPCYISPDAVVAPGVVVGPNSVIGAGSVIEAGATVAGSVVSGGHVCSGAKLDGAILCPGSRAGTSSSIGRGAVLGERASAGDGCRIAENVHLGAGEEAFPGSCTSAGYTACARYLAVFDGDGRLRGSSRQLTPEYAFALGKASAGQGRSVICAHDGADASYCAALAFAAGAVSGGAETYIADCPCEATLAWTARCNAAPVSMFARAADYELILSFYGADGYPVSRSIQRSLEAMDARHDTCRPGSLGFMNGTSELHTAAIASAADRSTGSIPVRIAGSNGRARILRSLFSTLGINTDSGPELKVSSDGFELSIMDSGGVILSNDELLTAYAVLCTRKGLDSLTLPPDAPYAAERTALDSGLTVYRRGREPHTGSDNTRDAFFLAASLSGLLTTSEPCDIKASLPVFRCSEMTFDLTCDAARLLRRAVSRHLFGDCEIYRGIRKADERGSVRLSQAGAKLLKIRTECATEELANELASDVVEKVKKLVLSQQS